MCSDHGYDEAQRQAAKVVLLMCGDYRLNGWRNSKVQEEQGINPLAVKLGLIKEGEELRFDRQQTPGPIVPILNVYNDPQSNREVEVTTRQLDLYRSELARGEQIFISTHVDCGRIGREGGNRDLDQLLSGLLAAAKLLSKLLPNQPVTGALLFVVNVERECCVEAVGYSIPELEAEVARLKAELRHE